MDVLNKKLIPDAGSGLGRLVALASGPSRVRLPLHLMAHSEVPLYWSLLESIGAYWSLIRGE